MNRKDAIKLAINVNLNDGVGLHTMLKSVGMVSKLQGNGNALTVYVNGIGTITAANADALAERCEAYFARCDRFNA
jgi:hypothetical protein